MTAGGQVLTRPVATVEKPIPRRRPNGKLGALALVTVVIGFLVGTPLLYLLWGTFFDEDSFTLGGFERAFGDSEAVELVWNSTIFAIGSAVLALVLGVALAYLQARTDVPFKGLFFAASLVPLIVPAVVYAPAWVFLLSDDVGAISSVANRLFGGLPIDIHGMSGMILVEGLHLAPIVFLFMVSAFRAMDPSLEESARVCGASWATVMRRITLPLVRPAIASGAVIVIVLGLETFEIPVMLGQPSGIYVFTSRIYSLTNTYPTDLGAAGALSISLMVIALLLMLAGRVGAGSSRGQQTVTGKAFRPAPIKLGRARPWVGGFVLAYFLISVVAPLAILVYMSFSPYFRTPSLESLQQLTTANYETLAKAPGLMDALINTVVLAVVSATLVMLLTLVASWFVVRSKIWGTKLLDAFGVVPLVIPGVVLGLGLSFMYLRSPIPIYGTLVILVIAYVTRFLPYGMRYAGAAMVQIGDELEEAAQVGGASWWKTMRRVILPLAAPGIISGWIFVLMVSFRELSSTVLLFGPDSEVLSIVMLRQYNEGTFGTIAALGVLMVGTLLALILAVYKLGSRFGVKVEA